MMDFKQFVKRFRFHGGVLLRGLWRTVYGALIAGLFAIAVYGFRGTSTETGYVAVCDFIAAVATTVIALANVYALGWSRKKGRK